MGWKECDRVYYRGPAPHRRLFTGYITGALHPLAGFEPGILLGPRTSSPASHRVYYRGSAPPRRLFTGWWRTGFREGLRKVDMSRARGLRDYGPRRQMHKDYNNMSTTYNHSQDYPSGLYPDYDHKRNTRKIPRIQGW